MAVKATTKSVLSTTVSASYLTGNLGKDTINVQDVVKGATIFGGGGFLFDTSTDGADS